MRALVIEDQEETASFFVKGLNDDGFAVDWEKDGKKALWKARFIHYDVVISDLHLPELSGTEILEKLRKNRVCVPFIMVTVEQELKEKLSSFNLGADDYLIKPFPISELLARVRAVLRRGNKIEGEKITRGAITLDKSNFKVTLEKQEIFLRRKEYDLLYYFMVNANQVLSRSLILEKVWDMNADPFTNTVDVHIQSLRKRIKDKQNKIIKTIYGRGYMFSVN